MSNVQTLVWGKQQRDDAMFEFLELHNYVHVAIITNDHDLFLQLKTTFRHAFRSFNSVLCVDYDVLEPSFIINYTVFYKIQTIVTNYSSRQQDTIVFQTSIPHLTRFSSCQLFICSLKY